MRMLFVFVFSWVCFFVGTSASDSGYKLLFVDMLFRHGDRGPLQLYPNDPNSAASFPNGLGSLTELGMQQMFALGKFLRTRYEGLSNFTLNEVRVNSSAIDRSIQSGMSTMASFFAPSKSFLPDLQWQPVIIHYAPAETDKYLSPISDCPIIEQQLNSQIFQDFLKDHKTIIDYLAHYSGYAMKTFREVIALYDCLTVEILKNLEVPLWVDKYYSEFRTSLLNHIFNSFSTTDLSRLRGGPLLGAILQDIDQKSRGENSGVKFQIYSGHDSQIISIMTLLKVFNDSYPPYATTLLFELYETPSGEKMIRLLLQNSTKPEKRIGPLQLLHLPGCGEFCPLQQVLDMETPNLHWKAQCRKE